eukprot:96560_1
MTELKIRQKEITDKDMFWNLIGFEVTNTDSDLISIIVRHPLLLQHSDYNNKTMIQRLVEELQISNILNEYRIMTSRFQVQLSNYACILKIIIN